MLLIGYDGSLRSREFPTLDLQEIPDGRQDSVFALIEVFAL